MRQAQLRVRLGRVTTAAVMVIAIALAVVAMVGVRAAHAAVLWSWTPSPFSCNANNNSCVAGTGFDPTVSYWGQATNPKGNCTNYAAYRLSNNGATKLTGSGNAITWKDRVIAQFGAAAVNTTPTVGSIAWWGGSSYPDGHVAYVEAVQGNTIHLTDSSYNMGSSRRILTSGQAGYPHYFLHIKDAPSASTGTRGDFTGDRRADVAAFYNYGNGQTKLFLFTSTGNGFTWPTPVFDSGPGGWTMTNAQPVPA
jgi:surface antigen